MILLVLDTAGIGGAVALADGRKILASRGWSEPRRQSELLWPAIGALLSKCGMAPDDLAGVVVCVGPGRLTGVRVGLMVGKALSALRSIPLVPVSTFEQIAAGWQGGRDQRLVVVSLRAGRQWGVQIFASSDGLPRAQVALVRIEREAAIHTLEGALGEAEPQFSGPGVEDLRTELEARWPGSVIGPGRLGTTELLAQLVAVGSRKLADGAGVNPRSVTPIYL